jgi:dTDP-4-dehydrorhamnose 3,5-epimerase
MRFTPTSIEGAVVVEPDPREDERGFFARLHCPREFAAEGIEFTPLQTSLSRNTAARTLRGMHYATEPEAKLVRCVRGRMLDVLFDIRRDSPSYRRTFAIELDETGARGLFVPAGVAHGFLTLEPDTDVLYQIDRIYRPGFDAGLRWNDPAFAFQWPFAPAVIGARDETWPDFKP